MRISITALFSHAYSTKFSFGITAYTQMTLGTVIAFLLLGLGYRVLSVAPPALPLLRWLVRQVDVRQATLVAEAALAARKTSEVVRLVKEGVAVHVDLRWLEAGRLPRTRRSRGCRSARTTSRASSAPSTRTAASGARSCAPRARSSSPPEASSQTIRP